MVPKLGDTLHDPHEPKMVHRQGGTWDGPHVQRWSLRLQDGPQEPEGTMDGLHGANPSAA